MTTSRTYTIPADRQYLLDEWMGRLAKIAKRIGVDRPTYTVVRETQMVDPTMACDVVGWVSTVPAIEVEVTVPELRLDGFEWVATVQHTQVDGTYHNVVHTTDDDIGMAYTNAAPRCDRCGKARHRSQTLVIRDKDGDLLMVGGTCQKDLLGHSGFPPAAVIAWGEELSDGMSVPGDYTSPLAYVARAQAIIRTYGWAPADATPSTRTRVAQWGMDNDCRAVTAEDNTQVTAAIEALTNLENRTLFESNMFAAIHNGRKARKNLGLLCYLPEWYRRRQQEAVAAEVVEKTPAADVPLTEARVVVTGVVTATYVRDTQWGTQHKMTVKTDDGYTVNGTQPSRIGVEVGDRVTFTARLTRSDQDSTFGFYNRPTQAKVLD